MKIMRKRFTLVELISSMAIFSLLMLMLMQIFSSTQNTTTKAAARTTSYAAARLFLDMLSNDLQNAVYHDTLKGFQRTFAVAKSGTESSLWMVTSKPYSLCGYAKDSKLCEVKYTLVASNDQFGPFRIRYEILPEYGGTNAAPVHNADFDYRNTAAANPSSTMSGANSSYILDNVASVSNVAELKIRRAFQTSANYQWYDTWTGSDTHANRLPNMLLITLSVVDPESLSAYTNASAGEKEKYLRKFTRVVTISRGQSY